MRENAHLTRASLKQDCRPVLPDLFITVAYFQFENFPWRTSKSQA